MIRHRLRAPYCVLHKSAIVYERIYVKEVQKNKEQTNCLFLIEHTHAAISVYYVLRDTHLLMEYFVCVLVKLLRKNVAYVDVNRKLLAKPWYWQPHRQGSAR